MQMWLWLSAAVASLAFASNSNAATCSDNDVRNIAALYQSAGKLSGCSKYATFSDNGAVSIAYKCDSTTCVPIMQELQRKLPDCEYKGVNNKKDLWTGLYTQCKLCTDEQDNEITALWKTAAQTAACLPYSSSSSYSTSFSWPCSARSCTAVLKDLASKVPDCFTGTINEKNRILRAVDTCTSTTPSTNSPSPASTSSSAATPAPTTRAPSSGTSSPAATSTPASTSSPSNSNSNSNSTSSDSGGAECSEAEQAASAALWEGAAADSACSKYATVTATSVLIVWPCSATSCTSVMADIGAKLPSCVLPGLSKSEKSTVLKTVENCKAGSNSVSGGSGQETSTSDTSSSSTTTDGSYSSSSCTATQVKSMADDYLSTANSAECKQYATITATRISIYAPCTSLCVLRGFQNLANDVPNCVYAFEGQNKKKELKEALATCPPLRSGRFLQSSKSDYVKFEFTATTIDASSSVTAAPAKSAANRAGGEGHSLALVFVVALLLVQVWAVL